MTKKIIASVLVFVMLISMTSIATFAVENESDAIKTECLFYDKVIESLGYQPNFYSYNEKYYHHIDDNDLNSDIDWVLIEAHVYGGDPASIKSLVFDRVFTSEHLQSLLVIGWGIYDVKTDELIGLTSDLRCDLSKYEGLEQALDEVKAGNPLGDADFDGELSVLDATYIQRAIARLCDFKNDDNLGYYGLWGSDYGRPLDYISDIDGDGERTILDATAIQLKLAGLE